MFHIYTLFKNLTENWGSLPILLTARTYHGNDFKASAEVLRSIDDGEMPFDTSNPVHPRLSTHASAQAWLVSCSMRLSIIGIQFLPLVLSALYFRRCTGWGAIAGLTTGIATLAWLPFGPLKNPFGIHVGLIGLLVNTVSLGLVSLLMQPGNAGIIAEFETTAKESVSAFTGLSWEKKYLLCTVIIISASPWPPVAVFNRIEPYIAGQPMFVV